jgi:ribA/ribD-fused uncharacterized protein
LHDFDPEYPGQPTILTKCYPNFSPEGRFQCVACGRRGDRSAAPLCPDCAETCWRSQLFFDLTPKDLRAHWSTLPPPIKPHDSACHAPATIAFFGPEATYGSFSNWYEQPRRANRSGSIVSANRELSFPFTIPDCCWDSDFGDLVQRDSSVSSGEAAIMLCKAALFQDAVAYQALLHGARGRASPSPAECKRIGRSVRGFRADVWDRVILSVAFAAVIAKYWGFGGALNSLPSTRGHILVEASPRDSVWAAGLTEDDPLIYDPRQWRGANVLGWALMELRERLPGGRGTFGVPRACPSSAHFNGHPTRGSPGL